ncbi:MAG: type II toxin-antitoxin system HicB family antitoxin [Sulfuricellaceae bacterium]
MIDRYRVEIFWDDDSAAFIAIATDLPGCSAAGDTRREALDELQDAMLSWLQANAAMGRQEPLFMAVAA